MSVIRSDDFDDGIDWECEFDALRDDDEEALDGWRCSVVVDIDGRIFVVGRKDEVLCRGEDDEVCVRLLCDGDGRGIACGQEWFEDNAELVALGVLCYGGEIGMNANIGGNYIFVQQNSALTTGYDESRGG